jgi:hypothetical protein
MKWLAALLLLVIVPIVQAADPAPIGRIFFSPEQRAQLDTLRTQKAVATQIRDEPVPENVSYNGIVRRSDGITTVWVNNEAMTDAELRVKQSIVGRVDSRGRILLQTPAAGAGPLQLKVGQSAELLSGKIDETYAAPRPAPVVQAKPAVTEKPAAADSPRSQPGGDARVTAPEVNKGPATARP